jgi:hypothetical protein
MHALNKIHNLMLNCTSTKELQYRLQDVALDNLFNGHYDSVIDSVLISPVLAAECSVLPMYYLRASTTSGLKQDRFGNWY